LTVRIGIIGAGNISRTHARAAREVADVSLVAHWSRSLARSEKLAADLGGTAYATLEEMLESGRPDVVLVGTPSGLHAEHAAVVAERGVHVLVEKPLDISTTQVDMLLQTCESAGVTLGVFYQDRTAPQLAWLKRMIDDGRLGSLFLLSARVKWFRPPEYYASSTWRGTAALDGGGALMNQGTHTVDLLLWLAGDVSRVFAHTRTALHEIAVEDTAIAALEFVNGAIGTFEASTAAFPGFPRRIELTGSNGTAIVEGDRVVSVETKGSRLEPPPQEQNLNPSASSPVVSDIAGHRRVIEDFLDAVAMNRRPLCDGREGRRSVALVEAIYESARRGTAVSVEGPEGDRL
jgi:predicted dehydrogenase